MIVSLIVAMDENYGIGYQGKLPWKLSTDLKRFRSLTTHHHIVMGRKTFDSIGRPLPNRTNIILTRQTEYRVEGCVITHSLSSALNFAADRGEVECFIIGGSKIYQESIELADRIYLTKIHSVTVSDVFFPNLNLSTWEAVYREDFSAGFNDQYDSTFTILIKRGQSWKPEGKQF